MSWTPYVDADTDARDEAIGEANALLLAVLNELRETNREILRQLKLLNLRVEEAFGTRIFDEDVSQ